MKHYAFDFDHSALVIDSDELSELRLIVHSRKFFVEEWLIENRVENPSLSQKGVIVLYENELEMLRKFLEALNKF